MLIHHLCYKPCLMLKPLFASQLGNDVHTYTLVCVSKLILNAIGQLLAMMIIVNNQCGDFLIYV